MGRSRIHALESSRVVFGDYRQLAANEGSE
jgi:hypothetical protein